MELIRKKRVSDSVIIGKTRLLQLTNNVSNLVSLLGVSAIISPIPNEAKNIIYLFILFCLVYSSLNGNDSAAKIIEERKKKGDLFSKHVMDDNLLVKMTNEEFNNVKKITE